MLQQSKIYADLNEIFCDIFMRNDIELSPELALEGVEEWDSFKQIEIIMACEEKWGFKFDIRELDSIHCVGDIAAIVGKRAS